MIISSGEESMHIPFVDLHAQYLSIKEEVDAAIHEVLDSSAYILGPAVTAFEKSFAEYIGTQYAIGVDSGTQAIELALRAIGLQAGDEVILPANTFIATALPVSRLGAKPVLVDINEQTYNITAENIEKAITKKTRAILPVHLYGQPVAELEAILDLAQAHHLEVIEDACQAHGAYLGSKRAGSFGKAAAFSFYPGKNLGAYGDAGMVVTNDPAVAEQVKQLRNYGQSKKYHHDQIGFNHRMDSIQAAVLNVKLKYLDGWNAARRNHAARYIEALSQVYGVITPSVPQNVEPIWHIFALRSKQRDQLISYLEDNDISTGIHYPIPIHLQPAYANLGYHAGDFPVTEQIAQEQLSLPMYAELDATMIDYVTQKVSDFSNSSMNK